MQRAARLRLVCTRHAVYIRVGSVVGEFDRLV